MIGIQGDIRFMTGTRYQELMAEAAVRRLAAVADRDRLRASSVIGRLRTHIAGAGAFDGTGGAPAAAAGTDGSVTPPATIAVLERTASAAAACSGADCHEGRAAA